jgi:DnaK suppressor protein
MPGPDVARVRLELQKRRRVLLEATQRTAAELERLRADGRITEPVEASQSEQAQYDLAQLGEVERREVADIDAALERLDAGEYGVCRRCGDAIEPGRVAAMPFVLECTECAREIEEERAVERKLAQRGRSIVPE